MHMNAKKNEYAALLGELLDDAPKAVIAAVAVSLIIIASGEENMDASYIQKEFLREWNALHNNGIVPQFPRGKR